MSAAPADLAQRLKEAVQAANLPPQLLVEYSVYLSQHEDLVLKAFRNLEELTNTPDVEAFVKAVLKGGLHAHHKVQTTQMRFDILEAELKAELKAIKDAVARGQSRKGPVEGYAGKAAEDGSHSGRLLRRRRRGAVAV